MIKILFVCHGNICRSPIAEFIMKDKIKKLKLEKQFFIDSCGVSNEEAGNKIYPKAFNTLVKHNIFNASHIARQMTKSDYENFDYIFMMDKSNIRNFNRLFGSDYKNKISLITEYLDGIEDIEDPWYTDNFELIFNQIEVAIENILKKKFGIGE
ncbi:MAG: low molecular weight phosphotyrosine protein phosphatase [Bacilli bacterium]|nr:low molecular weight phosphotyrosine protein phosphatase [Bacilli bacterium]